MSELPRTPKPVDRVAAKPIGGLQPGSKHPKNGATDPQYGGLGWDAPLPLSSAPTQDWTMPPAVWLAFRAALGAARVVELRATLV
jgi:hypothetical protein